jgi:hypothetical protein
VEFSQEEKFKRAKPKNASLKPLDLEYAIKAPASYPKTKIYQETLAEELIQNLEQERRQWHIVAGSGSDAEQGVQDVESQREPSGCRYKSSEYPLEPLIYPLVQIAIGVIR